MRGRQTDPDFVQFESIEMGYRAAFVLLENYRKRYNCLTLRKIIFRWAPPKENNSYVYLYHVCLWSGMENPDHVLEDDEMPRLVAAMHRQENGCKANMQQVKAGYEMYQMMK